MPPRPDAVTSEMGRTKTLALTSLRRLVLDRPAEILAGLGRLGGKLGGALDRCVVGGGAACFR